MHLSRLDSFIIIIGALITAIDAVQLSLLSEETQDVTRNAITPDVPEISYRLPKTVQPKSYDIKLIPTFEPPNFTFKGILRIEAVVAQNVTEIVLHAGNLEIQTAVVSINNEVLSKPPFKHLKSKEKLILPLVKTVLTQTQITIGINYNGQLSDTMTGFYKSFYRDADNNLRWLAATQFESTAARHAFPCFDEPEFKATFKITISRDKRPKGYTSISNMPLGRPPTGTPNPDNWDTFEATLPMSTYLVGFVISDFKNMEKGNIRGWARPNAYNQTDYALVVASQAKKYFENLLENEYSLSKMDMVALPDFATGAMENWGLITYRENRLLYDPFKSSDMARQDIGSVVVHEYCHMWFGNLVTPAWWGYVWLSEGFARYFQYKAMGKLQNGWNMEGQFVVDQQMTAYGIDGVETSQPLSRNPSNDAEVAAMGDGMAYSKGASVIRMMNLFLGDKIFNAALKDYIKDRAQSTATPDDLWKAMQKQVDSHKLQLGNSVKNIMENWTLKSGYPVVTVSVDGKGNLQLKQERFLLRNFNDQPTDTTWWVPITFATKTKPDFSVENMVVKDWLREKSLDLKVGLQSDEWVVLNVQSSGFYRVNYDAVLWSRIIKVLNSPSFTHIHEVNRAAIIDDLLNLARAGSVDYVTALDGLRYLKRERSYLPFKAALNALDRFNRWFLEDELNKEVYRHYILSLIRPAHQALGLDDMELQRDNWLNRLLRQELNKLACKLNDKNCKLKFLKLFAAWEEDNLYDFNEIPKNHRYTAYCMAVKYRSPKTWEFLWQKYLKENSPTEKDVMLKALGCTEDKAILKKYLGYALMSYEQGGIRKQDSRNVFSAVGSSGLEGANYVIDFIKTRFAEMQKYHGNHGIAQILKKVSEYLTTANSIENFEKFIKVQQHKLEDVLPTLNEALKIAKSELDWYNKNARGIMSFIKRQSDDMDYVLPEKIIPTKYEITVQPSFDTKTFKGTVKIRATVIEDTRDIFLHSANLTYHWISVSLKGTTVAIVEPWLVEEYDTLQIKMKEELKKNMEIDIEMRYTGYLNNRNLGFYRTYYIKRDEESGLESKKWIAATHLQPVGARRMFPCVDHPKMKAIFQLTAIVPRHYHALSNTEIDRITSDHNKQLFEYKFKETPVKMSTYLLALVVTDFATLSTNLNFEKKCSVWARPNVLSEAKYSLQLIPPIVKHFENLFKIKYELPKLDMVALPDLPMGAMENWGLLTYRESRMLYNDKHTSLRTKQRITNVIVHELSHQWFGNLVTPAEWKYLWLSEGFARYFQYLSGFELSAGWSLETQFVVDGIHTALATDGLTSSKAMNQEVYTPTQIESKFDGISYDKAASVIRMLEKLIGRESFYKGLQQYLERRKHSHASPDQLYETLQNALGNKPKYNVMKFMNSWTNEAGYPVVHATFTNDSVTLTQKRFLLRKSDNTSPASPIWIIPITWTRQKNANPNQVDGVFLLDKEQGVLKLNDMDIDECGIFNVEQTGFYRVNYDSQHWKKIISCLNDRDYRMIPEINRAALLDDLFNLGRADEIDYDTVLTATKYLTKETAYAPWRAFFEGMKYLHDRFFGSDIYQSYKRYMSAMLEELHMRFGHQESHLDSYPDKLLRPYVFEWMCRIRHPMCDKISSDYLQDKTIVPVDLRETLYCHQVRIHPNMVTFLWQSYQTSASAIEKSLILRSLACSPNKAVINKLMTKAIQEDSEIRYQDSPEVFSSICKNYQILPHLMSFIESNYNRIIQYYGGYSQLKNILDEIASKISTEDLLLKYEALIKVLKTKILDLSTSLDDALARARYEMRWYESHSTQIRNWLESNYENNYARLPTDFAPMHYDIYIAPQFKKENPVFRGTVDIVMMVTKATSFVALHADQLKIANIKAYVNDPTNGLFYPRKSIEASHIVFPGQQILLITFKKTIPVNTNVGVVIEYSGVLNDETRGFYAESYEDNEGRVRWIAATKFKPTYARKAFPCFDEPAFKATFFVQIERPNDYTSLSNMRRIHNYAVDQTRTCDVYATRDKMSTYMVTFVVLDMDSIETKDQAVRVWGRPNLAVYAEDIPLYARKIMKDLEGLLDMKQPQQKLDLVGVPNARDVAVEHWGLVTYREDALFINNQTASSADLAYSRRSIIRGLTHTWFGNLVTCDWWNNVWLQEGFSEYFQWLFDNPSGNYSSLTKYFTVDVLQDAMRFEDNYGFDENHALNDVSTAQSNIENIFDTITSKKAASILRMVHLTLGDKIFWEGLHKYLDKFQHGTANPKDLWTAFLEGLDGSIIQAINGDGNNQALEMSVDKWFRIMSTWTNIKGYPIVNVTRKEDEGMILFSQMSNNDDGEYHWIPITLTSASSPNFMITTPRFWLLDVEQYMKIQPGGWFVVNVQQAGYYRVNYDAVSWKRLIDVLHSKNYAQIHVINRAQIIDDLFSLARQEYIDDWRMIINATRYLVHEEEFLPWKAFFNGFQFLIDRLQGAKNYSLLASHVISLTSAKYKSISFSNSSKDTDDKEMLKDLILQWVCKYDYEDCVRNSYNLFLQWKRDPLQNMVPSNLKTAVYCTSIKSGTYEDWEFLWDQYFITNFPSERISILKALGCTLNATALESYLNAPLLYKMDEKIVFRAVYSSSRVGITVFLKWFKQEFRGIYQHYGNWKSVANLLSDAAQYISTEQQLIKLEHFILGNAGELLEIMDDLYEITRNVRHSHQWARKHSQNIMHAFTNEPVPEEPKKPSAAVSHHSNIVFFITFVATVILFNLFH